MVHGIVPKGPKRKIVLQSSLNNGRKKVKMTTQNSMTARLPTPNGMKLGLLSVNSHKKQNILWNVGSLNILRWSCANVGSLNIFLWNLHFRAVFSNSEWLKKKWREFSRGKKRLSYFIIHQNVIGGRLFWLCENRNFGGFARIYPRREKRQPFKDT